MKLIPLIVFFFFTINLILGVYLFYQKKPTSDVSFSKNELNSPVKVVSETPLIKIRQLDTQSLQDKLNEIDFWGNNGVMNFKTINKETAKSVTLHLTDKVQTDVVFGGVDNNKKSITAQSIGMKVQSGNVDIYVSLDQSLLKNLEKEEIARNYSWLGLFAFYYVTNPPGNSEDPQRTKNQSSYLQSLDTLPNKSFITLEKK